MQKPSGTSWLESNLTNTDLRNADRIAQSRLPATISSVQQLSRVCLSLGGWYSTSINLWHLALSHSGVIGDCRIRAIGATRIAPAGR
jgi:hypothetical protein